ncbi:hypothetical protein C7H09_15835 [Marinobacter fuscus]|uniref:Uncharacterized protein n=1 Tax=Marinobacter fuscus TaxID=2109942 RepID=A0A2T1K4R4_9GAMM|nr:hypothetical protein [Marinobacter fuscus]PSF05075.1 hypothetical protein C7H09_15835 [Marinobacter fuscus]
MNSRTLLDLALQGVDNLGFQLDSMGITSRVNRHNIAAFLMAEQKHLEGEWDSLQAKMACGRIRFEHLTQQAEDRAGFIVTPLLNRIYRARASQ